MTRRPRHRTLLVPGALLVVLLLSISLAATAGAVDVPLAGALRTWLAWLGLPVSTGLTAGQERILTGLRFPRILTGALVGGLLGLAATVQQGTLRSPHAGPTTTGAAAGGLLGAALALLVLDGSGLVAAGLGAAGHLPARIIAAATGAWAAQHLVVRQVIVAGRVHGAALLIGGLAVSALVGATASLMLFLGAAGAQTAATVLTSWAFGGLLVEAGMSSARAGAIGLVVTVIATAPLMREMDVLALGEETAASSGIDVSRTRHLGVLISGVATGIAVALAGVIAFVGLAAVHGARIIVGPRHRVLTVAAVLIGAIATVLADLVGRVIAAPAELPVGVLTAALGAPILFVLLRRLLGGTST